MSLNSLCTEEEWLATYGTRRQLEIFQPVIDALQSIQPREIDIRCCGTAMTPEGGNLLKMCVWFRPTDQHFCIYFDEYRDWGMFVHWADKYLRMHGAANIHSEKYENLPEPVICGLTTEQHRQGLVTGQHCINQASQLSSITAADAWI